jgi:hypothetical protein
LFDVDIEEDLKHLGVIWHYRELLIKQFEILFACIVFLDFQLFCSLLFLIKNQVPFGYLTLPVSPKLGVTFFRVGFDHFLHHSKLFKNDLGANPDSATVCASGERCNKPFFLNIIFGLVGLITTLSHNTHQQPMILTLNYFKRASHR